jgi:AI-2 transport protein TqsA|eukprot:COSAG01_NODE_447_length_16933_cov_9.983426_10_plen_65_part_00
MFDGSAEIALEIESSVKNYISLKTMISFLTGVLVAIILMLLQVKMAVLFGLLSFLLNFVSISMD